MSPDRHWIAPVLYMAMIIALSSIPGSTGPDTPAGPADWIPSIVSNALHVPVYAGLAFLWARALVRRGHMPLQRAAWIALIVAAVFGGIDEAYQGLIDGRSTAPGDWLADAIGAVFGCLVFLKWQHRKKLPR